MLKLPREDAITVLRMIIRPIVRFCLEHTLSIQDLEAAARFELVKLTHEQMKARGEKVNASRLSISTGVYRQEIGRILSEEEPTPKEPPGVLARIIGKWEGHPKYRHKNGSLKTLSFKEPDSEFAELVSSITTALGPAAVLYALERRNLAVRNGDKLRLLRGGNVVSDDAIAGFRLAAQDLQTTLDAAESNIEGAEEIPHSHIRTEYDNIYEADLPRIKKWINAQVRIFHRRARAYLSKFDKDLRPSKNPNRRSGAKVVLTSASFSTPSTEPTKT